MPPRELALDFVRQHSPQPDQDLLPGMCLLTERWLAQVTSSSCYPGIRESPTQEAVIPSLLSVLEPKRQLPTEAQCYTMLYCNIFPAV